MKIGLPFLSFLLLSAAGYAQPVIHASDYEPSLLSEFEFQYRYGIGTVDPGESGADLIWNFGSLPDGETLHYDIETCPVGPDCGSVPGATEYMKSSSSLIQAFYEKNGSQWTQLGERNVSTGSISIYEDDYQMLKFPMTYLQTFEDTYNKGDAGTGDGTISSLIDGYGTLITPYATYTDVLRQKIVDVTFVPSGSMILTYTTTQYYWYKAGCHHQIMAIINLVITHSSGDAMAATWSHAYSVTPALSISDDKIAHASIKIYPNPVHNNRFTVSAESGAIQKIEVTDVLGRSIFHQDYTRIQHTEVFLDQAARGTYWCTVYTDKGMSIRKISLS